MLWRRGDAPKMNRERWMEQMRMRPACDRGLNIPPSPGKAEKVKSFGSAMTTT